MQVSCCWFPKQTQNYFKNWRQKVTRKSTMKNVVSTSQQTQKIRRITLLMAKPQRIRVILNFIRINRLYGRVTRYGYFSRLFPFLCKNIRNFQPKWHYKIMNAELQQSHLLLPKHFVLILPAKRKVTQKRELSPMELLRSLCTFFLEWTRKEGC